MNAKCKSTHWKPKINVSAYVFDPWMVLLASKTPLLVFCLWPSRAITHSVQSSPCLAIHGIVSWVTSHKPLWIPSRWFMGWQLIYPLYTFQITLLSPQDSSNTIRKERRSERKGKTCWDTSVHWHITWADCISTDVQRTPQTLTTPRWPHEWQKKRKKKHHQEMSTLAGVKDCTQTICPVFCIQIAIQSSTCRLSLPTCRVALLSQR